MFYMARLFISNAITAFFFKARVCNRHWILFFPRVASLRFCRKNKNEFNCDTRMKLNVVKSSKEASEWLSFDVTEMAVAPPKHRARSGRLNFPFPVRSNTWLWGESIRTCGISRGFLLFFPLDRNYRRPKCERLNSADAERCAGGPGAMKVYFCGSIRGGRNDVTIYQRIIQKLQSYGTVLTEHVGSDALSSKGQRLRKHNLTHTISKSFWFW